MIRTLLLILAWPAAASLALDILVEQHVDLAVNFNSALVGTATNPWRLVVRDHDGRNEFGGQRAGFADPEEVILRASAEAEFPVPADPGFGFLGTPGEPVWVLPATQENGILYLGNSSEIATSTSWTAHNVGAALLARGVPGGAFSGNQFTLRLESFTGPGDVFVFSIDSFGAPQLVFDTSNGLSAADARVFTPANHSHFNWAFTAPGDYFLGLRASGTLGAGSASTQSDLTTFRFNIVPEPGVASLLLCGATLALHRRRRAV